MGEVLEFSDISTENKGSLTPGKLKLSDQAISFKNNKTGKVEQISAADVEFVNWQKLVANWGLRLFLKNGSLHRFFGFKENEQDKVAKFFKNNYSLDMLEKELSVKGWNWGTAKFSGSVLSFDIGNLTSFEIPLHNVSQCLTGKNEVTMEFHQNDDAPVSLLEMRFHIPSSDLAGEDPVEAFQKQVMDQASVISVSGDAIAIFREIQCLTPRGRYDIKVFNTFFQLHGKTFDYKIPMSTVLRLFALPHKDGRQNYFVVSLDPPIKQGQTRYHFLVFLFGQDDETSIELPFSEEELKEKFDDKLTKEMSGPTFEVLGKLMRAIVNRKITTPGGFVGHTGTPAVSCSYKAAAGHIYPLERGFIFIHKPPLHIRFEEIACVHFARSGGSTRSFDFEVELKSSVVHTFSSIEKEEYTKLFNFISSKKLRVKNLGKNDKPSYADDFGDSDQEGAPDAYLARVKAEAEERDDEGEDSDEESTDEDFNPNMAESDVAEEFDSNPESTDSEDGSEASGSGGEKKEKKKKKKEKKERKPKSAKTISEKPRKKKNKREKDANAPKRPPTAYFMWLNENREKIKTDNPGISITEIAKKGGELWKTLDSDDKKEYENRVAKLKEEYNEAMKEYKASGGGASREPSSPAKSSPKKNKSSPSKKGKDPSGPKNPISKEFIEDSDSSDSDADKKTPKKFEVKKEKSQTSSEDESEKEKTPAKKEVKKEIKKEKKESEDEDDEFPEEPEESTPATTEESGGGSDDDSD